MTTTSQTARVSTQSPITLRRKLLLTTAATAALGWGLSQNLSHAASSQDLPGKGITVLPVKSALAEENFQTLLVMKALEKLGYTVKPWEELDYPLIHVAVANGDATFMANHWNPHHAEFYKQAGGDAKLSRKGVYAAGAAQGYMIDKKTAQAHGITNLAQLKDPKIAALFDIDGDGKADLAMFDKSTGKWYIQTLDNKLLAWGTGWGWPFRPTRNAPCRRSTGWLIWRTGPSAD